MATAEKKKEKEQFFKDLARLDLFIDDEDEFSPDPPVKIPCPTLPRCRNDTEDSRDTSIPTSTTHTANQISGPCRKRKAIGDDPISRPTINPAETRAQTKPKPQPTRSFSSPVRGTKKPKQQAMKRTKSHLDNPNPLWRKGDIPLKTIAKEQQVFDGLVFCT